jgi:hypothetical protein
VNKKVQKALISFHYFHASGFYNMSQGIHLEWPEVGIKVTAGLWIKEEPEVCEILWKNIEHPLKMICRHTLSTGGMFSGGERPPRKPIRTGSQTNPLGRRRWLPYQIELGSITNAVHGGYGGLSVFYGRSTECLQAPGTVIAKVESTQMKALAEAGKYVWNAQYITHVPTIMTVSRLE